MVWNGAAASCNPPVHRAMQALACALAMLAPFPVAGQAMYKIVTPDGKVTYSDKPPAAGSGNVREMPSAPPAAPTMAAPAPRDASGSPPRSGPGLPGGSLLPPESLRLNQEIHGRYRECVAANPKEARLATASKELADSRMWMAAAEKMQQERAQNPEKFAGKRADPQWAKLEAEFNPARVRAAQAAMFQEYRAAGGTAARIEDVTPVPHPCTHHLPGRPSGPPTPAAITEPKTLVLPAP